MEVNLSDVLKFGISLFSVIDPLGSIPIFLTLTKSYSDKEIKKISLACACTIFITITISLLFGERILHFFGISLPSFQIAGGILIGFMGINMMSAKHDVKMSDEEVRERINVEEIGIVPLAIPLLAGPGTISTTIINGKKFSQLTDYLLIFVIIFIIAIATRYILIFARPIGNKLGTVGVNVMTRIMGLILMALSVEFIAAGIKEIFNL